MGSTLSHGENFPLGAASTWVQHYLMGKIFPWVLLVQGFNTISWGKFPCVLLVHGFNTISWRKFSLGAASTWVQHYLMGKISLCVASTWVQHYLIPHQIFPDKGSPLHEVSNWKHKKKRHDQTKYMNLNTHNSNVDSLLCLGNLRLSNIFCSASY